MPDGQQYQIYKGRLFCINTGEYYKPGKFTKKQRRAYMRLKSGMTLGEARKERLCFMTLTTKYDKAKPKSRLERVKVLNYAFTKLKQRIEYELQKRMYERYCKKKHLTPWVYHGKKKILHYPRLWERFFFKFKYFKIKTSEGGGVLHIVFRKGWNVPQIPYCWLSKQWQEIWGSWDVSISQVDRYSAERLSMYIVGQYMAKQPTLRMSYGQSWVYMGFRKTFKHLIEVYGERARYCLNQRKASKAKLCFIERREAFCMGSILCKPE